MTDKEIQTQLKFMTIGGNRRAIIKGLLYWWKIYTEAIKKPCETLVFLDLITSNL